MEKEAEERRCLIKRLVGFRRDRTPPLILMRLSDFVGVGEVRILVRGRRLDRGGRGDPASDEARWGRTYRPENSIRAGGPTEINLVASVTK